MPQAALVAEALRAWREAERVLDAIPANSPDHETARLLVRDLRDLYAELTEEKATGAAHLRSGEATISRATEILGRVRVDGLPTEPATD